MGIGSTFLVQQLADLAAAAVTCDTGCTACAAAAVDVDDDWTQGHCMAADMSPASWSPDLVWAAASSAWLL